MTPSLPDTEAGEARAKEEQRGGLWDRGQAILITTSFAAKTNQFRGDHVLKKRSPGGPGEGQGKCCRLIGSDAAVRAAAAFVPATRMSGARGDDVLAASVGSDVDRSRTETEIIVGGVREYGRRAPGMM